MTSTSLFDWMSFLFRKEEDVQLKHLNSTFPKQNRKAEQRGCVLTSLIKHIVLDQIYSPKNKGYLCI